MSRSPYYTSENYSGTPVNKDPQISEEVKDQEPRPKSPLLVPFDSSKIQKSSTSQIDKTKVKDRVPQFSDKYIIEKSQSEKVHPHDTLSGENPQISKKSESERREKRSDANRRSNSRERSRSHSKKSSISKSASGSARRNSRSPQQRERYEKSRGYKPSSTNEAGSNQRYSSYYERNPNFSKDVTEYLSQSEREVGYYERLLMNRKKQNPTKRNSPLGSKKRGSRSGSRERSKSYSRSRSTSRSQGLRRDLPVRDVQGRSRSREKSRSYDRNRSHSRDRARRRERSRSRNKSRSYERNHSQSRNRPRRRERSRSKSGSRNRNRRRGSSRSPSYNRGGNARTKYNRTDKKGRFDIEPSTKREEIQTIKAEESTDSRREPKAENSRYGGQSYMNWSQGGGNRNQRNQGEVSQSYNRSQSRINTGTETQSSNPETAIRYFDLKRQHEQKFLGQSNLDTNLSSRQTISVKDEPQHSANGYQASDPKMKAENLDINKQTSYEGKSGYNQFSSSVQIPHSADNTSSNKQTSAHKSRFSYTVEPAKEQQVQTESQQSGYSYPQNQQGQQYNYPHYPQYPQQMQAQNANVISNQNQNQSQSQNQYYSQSQSQYPYQQYHTQSQPQSQSKQRQFNSQYQSSQSQNTGSQYQSQYQYQYKQQVQQPQQVENAGNASRFSNKPYSSVNNEISKSSRDKPEGQDKGRSDNDNKYRDSGYYSKQSQQDEHDSYREGRNKPRVYESENYKKTQNIKNDPIRRYQDQSYSQTSSNVGGKYPKVQENYNGKKIIITKSNSSLNQNYYSNNGGSYKDRHREAGTRDN